MAMSPATKRATIVGCCVILMMSLLGIGAFWFSSARMIFGGGPAYPVIVLAGDIEFDAAFVRALEEALARGRRVLISERHREALGGEFARLAARGSVEVIEPWVNPATGRPAAIGNERLQQLAAEFLPVRVTGDAVQYAVNRTPRGWVVELINNGGVRKHGDQPVFDPRYVR